MIEPTETVNTEDVETDAVIENYIRENADSQYVNMGENFQLANLLLVKNTLFDGSLVETGDTIDSIMYGIEDGDMNELAKYIAQIPTYVAVYDVDSDSDYYVAYANTMMYDAKTQDYCFANNNDNGEVLDNCIYDSTTGIVYISKADYLDDFNGNTAYVYCGVQVQFMQVCGSAKTNNNDEYAFSDYTATAQYNVDEENADTVDVYEKTAEIFDLRTEFQLDTGLNSDDMEVLLNGISLENSEDSWIYETDTGILTLSSQV